jgi:hypothetical protein
MKLLFTVLVVVCLFSCKVGDNNRYFLVGYDASNGRHRSYGTFSRIGILGSHVSLKEAVFEAVKCQGDFTLEDCIITSIHEFRGYEDYYNFIGDRPEEKFTYCDSSDIIITAGGVAIDTVKLK